jgi:protein gp37
MASKIEWTDETWNVNVGCTAVSPGCDHCYAKHVAHRDLQPAHSGLTIVRDAQVQWNGTVRSLPARLEVPLRWHKPRRIFVDSMSDLFHPAVDYGFIARVFGVMAAAPQHQFQVLTKRPKRMRSILSDTAGAISFEQLVHEQHDLFGGIRWPGWPLPNVWLGTSIENDRLIWRSKYLDETPAAVRWLSLEPLLGPLPSLNLSWVDWVVVGGESGRGARPMDPAWVRAIRDDCANLSVPLFVKQAGSVLARQWKMSDSKGSILDEFPADLQIRQHPRERTAA